MDRHHVQAVEQILAEPSCAHLLHGVAIRRAHDSHVHGFDLGSADAHERARLHEAQQLGLQIDVHLADFVQEQCAVVRAPGRAHAIRHGPGEGALLVTEDLAFDQVAWQGGAVEGHKRTLGARTALMDGFGANFLAGPAFARDEDCRLAGPGRIDHVIHGLHGQGRSDKAVIGAAVELLLDRFDDLREALVFERVSQRDDQPVAQERFDEKIVCTEAHGLDRHIDRAVRRDDDHARWKGLRRNTFQNFDPVHVRKVEVQEDGSRHACVQLGQGVLAGTDLDEVQVFVLQVFGVHPGERRGVLDDEDGLARLRPIFRHAARSRALRHKTSLFQSRRGHQIPSWIGLRSASAYAIAAAR